MERETSVYRLYDGNGVLLYVGIAYQVPKRLGEHERSKPWFSEVGVIRVSRYPTRRQAEQAEAEAIYSEKPRENRAPGTTTTREAPTVIADVDAVVARHMAEMKRASPVEAAAAWAQLAKDAASRADAEGAAAVSKGRSYAQVGQALGITRNGARKRYGHLEVVG